MIMDLQFLQMSAFYATEDMCFVLMYPPSCLPDVWGEFVCKHRNYIEMFSLDATHRASAECVAYF